MSPFWQNVDDEIKYLNMNLKTLANLSGVPYPTITNGRNKDNSIPEMETAKKIANALHKPLEVLLGLDNSEKTFSNKYNLADTDKLYLYSKYEDIITILEDFPAPIRDSLKNTISKFHATYKMIQL